MSTCPLPPLPPPSPPIRPPIDEGIAGASARREHDRRAAKHEARIEATYGHGFIGRIARAVSVEPQSTRAWAIGAAGEERLARKLLKVPGIRILNDRRVPGTRGNIDHIVIAPAGVFVVDAKYIQGRIWIRNVGGPLHADRRLYVGFRDQSKLARAMSWQVDAVMLALNRAGIGRPPAVIPVLCFIDAVWPLLSRPRMFENVHLASPDSLVELLMSPMVVSAAGVDTLTDVLGRALPPKVSSANGSS